MDWMDKYVNSFDKPMFICEYAHAMGNAIGNLKEYWNSIESSSSTIGGAIWDWVDQAIYEPKEILNGTYMGRLHTGYDFPGPHQGNFCSNGIIPATRDESPKLKEVKAVYQYVKFDLEGIDDKKNFATVKIDNTYDFISMDNHYLLWETVENGNIVGRDSVQLSGIAPDNSKTLALYLNGTSLKTALKYGNEVMINLYVCQSASTVWSEKGHVVAQKQFELSSRGKLPELRVNSRVGKLEVKQTDKYVSVGNSFIFGEFERSTGRLTALRINGMDVVYGKEGFIYENHRFIENDRNPVGFDNGLEATGTYDVKEESDGRVIVTTVRKGSLCDTEIIYTFIPNGVMDMDAKFTPKSGDLFRTGLVCAVNPGLSNIDYYAYGPWENYIDRKEGCMMGRYSTTVDGMIEKYVKPQSMGNREGLRELKMSDKDGKGILIETEGAVSFSALPYEESDLTKGKHIWDIQKRPYIVLHLDAQIKGLGNGSCGPTTLNTYKIAQLPLGYKLRFSAAE